MWYSDCCLPKKDQCKSAAWMTWPNLAYQFKHIIMGWDLAVVDIAFCQGFAPTKISNSQWKHLSTLIVKGLLEVKPWSAGKSDIIILAYICMSCLFRAKTYPGEWNMLQWHPCHDQLRRSSNGLCQRLCSKDMGSYPSLISFTFHYLAFVSHDSLPYLSVIVMWQFTFLHLYHHCIYCFPAGILS